MPLALPFPGLTTAVLEELKSVRFDPATKAGNEVGSWVVLGVLLTTADFAVDAAMEDHCGSCTACIEACPTGAIVWLEPDGEVVKGRDARKVVRKVAAGAESDASGGHRVKFITKVPLDSGWLTGRFDADSRFEGIRSRWSAVQIAQRAELVADIQWLVEDGSELAHKAIAYLLSYDEVSCVIPDIRTEQQLESNLAATNYRLAPEERDKLEAFWDELTEDGAKLLPW